MRRSKRGERQNAPRPLRERKPGPRPQQSRLSEMARAYIRPEHMTVVVAGDLAKIGDGVRALPQFAGTKTP